MITKRTDEERTAFRTAYNERRTALLAALENKRHQKKTRPQPTKKKRIEDIQEKIKKAEAQLATHRKKEDRLQTRIHNLQEQLDDLQDSVVFNDNSTADTSSECENQEIKDSTPLASENYHSSDEDFNECYDELSIRQFMHWWISLSNDFKEDCWERLGDNDKKIVKTYDYAWWSSYTSKENTLIDETHDKSRFSRFNNP